MGPKKNSGQKRGADKKGGVVKKKAKKVKTAEEEEAEVWEQIQQVEELEVDLPMSPESELGDEVEDEEVDDEEVGDEEVDDEEVDDEEVDDEEDDEEEGDNQELQFEFGAWPPDTGDEDGLVNILTQTFLRTDIDLKGAADIIIAQSPHGTVIVQGPGPEEIDNKKEEEEEDENDGMIYGLCTTMGLNETAKDDAPKFVKDIFAYLLNRAKKGAPSEFYKRLEEIQTAADGKTALLINDRLLNFSPLIVPQMFTLLQGELDEKNMNYKTFIYIQKIRIAEGSDGSGSSSGKSSGEPPKKKGKMGKAEKKRAAAAALANADVEFDNVEDGYLFKLTAGNETHFDYPVHMDVEPGSKFHVVEKDGKKWNPFRRVVIMDAQRMKKFLENGAQAIVEND